MGPKVSESTKIFKIFVPSGVFEGFNQSFPPMGEKKQVGRQKIFSQEIAEYKFSPSLCSQLARSICLKVYPCQGNKNIRIETFPHLNQRNVVHWTQ